MNFLITSIIYLERKEEKNGVPFLGELPIVQSIRESGDSGYPAVLKNGITREAYMGLAESVARQIAIRNASQQKTEIVEIKA
jgi:ATP-binding protein involved in chromosome partitioning